MSRAVRCFRPGIRPGTRPGIRRTAATLLVATLAILSCATPSQASMLHPRASLDDGGPAEPLHLFFSLLLRLFEDAGGAMDPNGLH